MSDDEVRLLEQIHANPGDDQPRLVYADLLIARGDDRGDYIHAMVDEAARRAAGLPLRAREPRFQWPTCMPLETRWAEELGLGGIEQVSWDRGFPCRVGATIEQIVERADAIRRLPIVELSVGRPVRGIDRIVPALAHVERLVLGERVTRSNWTAEDPQIPPDDLAALAGADLPALRALRFHDSSLGDANAAVFAAARWLGQLEVLEIFGGPSPDGLARVATSGLSNLRTLALSLLTLKEPGARVLAALQLPALDTLRLHDLQIGEHYRQLFGSPRLARLRSLMVSKDNATAAIGTLAATEHARGLRELGLPQNHIFDPGVAALARSSSFPALEILDLRDNALTPIGAQALAASTTMPALKELRLAGNPFPSGRLERRSYVDEEGVERYTGYVSAKVPFEDIRKLFAHRPALRVE